MVRNLFLSPLPPQGLPFFVLALHLSRALGPWPAALPRPASAEGWSAEPALCWEARNQPSCPGRDELAVGVNTERGRRSPDSSLAAAVCPQLSQALVSDTSNKEVTEGREGERGLLRKVGRLTKEPLISIARQFTPQREEINEFILSL